MLFKVSDEFQILLWLILRFGFEIMLLPEIESRLKSRSAKPNDQFLCKHWVAAWHRHRAQSTTSVTQTQSWVWCMSSGNSAVNCNLTPLFVGLVSMLGRVWFRLVLEHFWVDSVTCQLQPLNSATDVLFTWSVYIVRKFKVCNCF